jgi:hypothetical protein
MAGRDDVRLAGGCQCGCVRYELSGAPDHVSVCHCRMCRKASGGPIMAFARVRKAALSWTRGQPASFRSSSLVERQFCAACGTPLTYNLIEGPNISVTIGSLDDPEAARPVLQHRALRYRGSRRSRHCRASAPKNSSLRILPHVLWATNTPTTTPESVCHSPARSRAFTAA